MRTLVWIALGAASLLAADAANTLTKEEKAAGWKLTIREQYQDPSPIRDYAHYQPRVTPAALINAAQRLGKLHIVNLKG